MKRYLLLGFFCVIIFSIFVYSYKSPFGIETNPNTSQRTSPVKFSARGPDPSTSTLVNRQKDISCYDEPSNIHGLRQFYSSSDELPSPGKSIFFHETSCFDEDGIAITARQACAVESAALMNPDMEVYLFILSPAKLSHLSHNIGRLLAHYDNVVVRRLFMKDYVEKTPLADLYSSGVLKSSNWPKSHTSDILRYLTLWKFGGIYLDLDVVVTTSLHDLANFAGNQGGGVIAAGAMGFGNTGVGQIIANACIEDLRNNFHGQIWAHNGPGVITRALAKLCGNDKIDGGTLTVCQGFKILPVSDFYPIPYYEWKRYFQEDGTNETMRLISDSRAVHVWNKLSSEEIVRIGSGVPYELVAQKYCPVIYGNSEKIF